jgi:beta-glucosidase-like glycosyl hydrolase
VRNYYQCIVPRLDGGEIRKNFGRYRSLVRKGIAGFIVFGGELDEVRNCIGELQEEARLPLIIASDLERGLGQQLRGGTLFPPAMALASAFRNANLAGGGSKGIGAIRRSFSALAAEAAYAGINAVLAPVLDINTNPKNPIIATRAFGEEEETVSFFGCEMIKALQRHGMAACGKHFPGHGDTAIDSHIGLPTVRRSLRSLEAKELKPFQKSADAGVKMIMLGHLSVPALDPSGIPVSLSEKAVAYLRKKMNYDGILITDAMNMGGIGKYPEEQACAMALRAGVDVILHPSDPDAVARRLEKEGVTLDEERLARFRKGLRQPLSGAPDFEKHGRLSRTLTSRAIRVKGDFKVTGKPFLVLLNDEAGERGEVFVQRMEEMAPDLRIATLRRDSRARDINIPGDAFVVVAVFSDTRAWKGGATDWLRRRMNEVRRRAGLFISFGSPYLLDSVGPAAKVFAYWDADEAQEAVADFLSARLKKKV